jgi:hypothetical protein
MSDLRFNPNDLRLYHSNLRTCQELSENNTPESLRTPWPIMRLWPLGMHSEPPWCIPRMGSQCICRTNTTHSFWELAGCILPINPQCIAFSDWMLRGGFQKWTPRTHSEKGQWCILRTPWMYSENEQQTHSQTRPTHSETGRSPTQSENSPPWCILRMDPDALRM